jgi:plasmid stabilization system protein ParE
LIRRAVIRAAAKHDIREARAWYRRLSRQLADDFVAEVHAAVSRVLERPLAAELVHRTLRRAVLHRFPYSLFYEARPDRIIVVAVLHQARDPEILEAR